MSRPWILLFLAGVAEVVWAIGLKQSHGFARLWPSVVTLAGMGASFVLLSQALKALPVGTAYAVWTGIGAVGTAIAGIVLLGESRDAARLVSMALIVVGILGLKLASPA
ncbi:MAG TPA: quaternary ammonium compound efflux SMR transporter SugE [Gemmatimonadales bacterium]